MTNFALVVRVGLYVAVGVLCAACACSTAIAAHAAYSRKYHDKPLAYRATWLLVVATVPLCCLRVAIDMFVAASACR